MSAKKLFTFSAWEEIFYIHRRGRPARVDRMQKRGRSAVRERGVSRKLNRPKGGDTAISWSPSVRARAKRGTMEKKAASARAVERRADKAAAVNEKFIAGYSKRYRLK